MPTVLTPGWPEDQVDEAISVEVALFAAKLRVGRAGNVARRAGEADRRARSHHDASSRNGVQRGVVCRHGIGLIGRHHGTIGVRAADGRADVEHNGRGRAAPSVPRLHRSLPFACWQVPAEVVALTNCVPSGSVSVRRTFDAADGPAFETLSV